MTDGLKDRHRSAIHGVLSSNPRVERAVLFGSRATGTFRTASDVDLALFGDSLTLRDQLDLAVAMEELTVPQRVDLRRHRDIVDSRVLEEIERHGVEWYTRSPRAERGRARPSAET